MLPYIWVWHTRKAIVYTELKVNKMHTNKALCLVKAFSQTVGAADVEDTSSTYLSRMRIALLIMDVGV